MMRFQASYLIGFATILTALTFQNCSDVNFSPNVSNGANGKSGDPTGPGIEESDDVLGGHFDLDTSTAVYVDGKGTTNHHEHEYDDKKKTNVVNFFDLIDPGFNNLGETIPANQSFYIRVANGDLSPKVALEINGVAHSVSSVQHGPYSLSGVAGTTKLSSLRALVATDAILSSGLVSTQTECVRANDFSADGRYRNGALIFQAVPTDKLPTIDPRLGVATDSAALLWEATLFWHEHGGSCR